MPAILTQGKTAIRDQLAALITHVGLSTDTTAFAAGQTTLSPAGGSPTVLIKTPTETVVDAATIDYSIAVNGDSEFTGATIFTIGLMQGASPSQVLSRSVRSQGIGVQAGDSFDVGIRLTVEDNT